MIDRNSNLVKVNSGDHRFAISRILKLKKFPLKLNLYMLIALKKISIMKNY